MHYKNDSVRIQTIRCLIKPTREKYCQMLDIQFYTQFKFLATLTIVEIRTSEKILNIYL